MEGNSHRLPIRSLGAADWPDTNRAEEADLMGHGCTWRRWLLMPMTAFAVGAPGAAAQETVDLTGRWSGMLTAGAQQIEIVYNLQVGVDDLSLIHI